MNYETAKIIICTRRSTYEYLPVYNKIRKVSGEYRHDAAIGSQWRDILGIPEIKIGRRLQIVIGEREHNGVRMADIVSTTPVIECFAYGHQGAA